MVRRGLFFCRLSEEMAYVPVGLLAADLLGSVGQGRDLLAHLTQKDTGRRVVPDQALRPVEGPVGIVRAGETPLQAVGEIIIRRLDLGDPMAVRINGHAGRVGVLTGGDAELVQLQGTGSVGAGDSMVAGFIAGYDERGDYDYALRLGTAAGGATAFSEGLGRRDEIYRLFERL